MTKWQPTYEVNEFVQLDPMWDPKRAGRLLLVTKIFTVWLGFRRTVRARAVFADTRVEVNVAAGLLISPEHPRWIDDSPAQVVNEVWRGSPAVDLDKLLG